MLVSDYQLPPDGTIVAVNPGHDGALVALRNFQLFFYSAAEYDSRPRHLPANGYFLLDCLSQLEHLPSVLATSGWSVGWPHQSACAPYFGVSDSHVMVRRTPFLGRQIIRYESTHERSHIFCTYGMSPLQQGEPCYVLVWEGEIGSFYEINERLRIRQLGPVLPNPGYKYAFLYDLADPAATVGRWRHDSAGKLMALSAYSKKEQPNAVESEAICRLLHDVYPPVTSKESFAGTPYFNCGVTNPLFLDLVKLFTDKMFDIFFSFARQHLRERYSLLISGGCGLNCEWNSRWRKCGLFTDVFVPPVPNDSGSAIGTAIEAQYALSENAKLDWNVYSGPEFIMDVVREEFDEIPFNVDVVAHLLAKNHVVAWVHGRAEMGPRALGNRSLLAAPFTHDMRDRLNIIKQREWYRPIAPVCLEEDAPHLFGVSCPSPYMLYFDMVRNDGLQAVTHVDGSARIQTVSRSQNEPLYSLLRAFKAVTGVGVLCNTSLNRKGCGFFNRSSDLFSFAIEKKLDVIVIGSRCFITGSLAASVRRSAVVTV